MADEKKIQAAFDDKPKEKRIVSVFIHEDFRAAFSATELVSPRYTFEYLREMNHLRITDTKGEKCKSLPMGALTPTWG